ncbi:sterol carrier protein domain-containing protein [Streptomyces tendae]
MSRSPLKTGRQALLVVDTDPPLEGVVEVDHGAARRGSRDLCPRRAQTADLTITLSALSSLYFGGMSAHHLAYAGHITAHTDGAIGRLTRMFRTDPEPHNSFGF